jgi:hypothetical protein
MRGFRMTEIQWHCASPWAHSATESVTWIGQGTNREGERGFDKCQSNLRDGRVLPSVGGGADTLSMGSSGPFVTLAV